MPRVTAGSRSGGAAQRPTRVARSEQQRPWLHARHARANGGGGMRAAWAPAACAAPQYQRGGFVLPRRSWAVITALALPPTPPLSRDRSSGTLSWQAACSGAGGGIAAAGHGGSEAERQRGRAAAGQRAGARQGKSQRVPAPSATRLKGLTQGGRCFRPGPGAKPCCPGRSHCSVPRPQRPRCAAPPASHISSRRSLGEALNPNPTPPPTLGTTRASAMLA
jgi:hypothetical protein